MLVRPDDAAVNAHLPDDVPDGIRLGLDVSKQSHVPSARQRTKRAYTVRHGPSVREVPPWRARPEFPEDAIEDLAVVSSLLATPTIAGQQWLHRCPRRIRNVAPSNHRSAPRPRPKTR